MEECVLCGKVWVIRNSVGYMEECRPRGKSIGSAEIIGLCGLKLAVWSRV